MNMVALGLWPISLRRWVFLPFEVLSLLSTISNFNPLLSNVSIVNGLNFTTKKNRLVGIKLCMHHNVSHNCSDNS